MNQHSISRRNFLGMTAGFGALAALGNLSALTANAQTAGDYKALVCVFLFGGNDGHNTVVPLAGGEYTAYQSLRGGLALPPNQLLAINAGGTQYGLHYGLPELQTLYTQGRAAIVANVGNLVRPTTRADLSQVPNQLFSHSDQVAQVQSGAPDGSLGTGWGGRLADLMQTVNTNPDFPPSISFNGTAVFATGAQIQAASLQPGNLLSQYAMNVYPPEHGAARQQAQVEIVNNLSSFDLVNAANRVTGNAVNLNGILQSAGSGGITTQFPATTIGNQLKEVARVLSIRSTVGMRRQVFFCGLGGFDTHSGQSYAQWSLLQSLSQALGAFYAATQELGIADRVTTFTASDFGRTLQPNNSGTDHGWGSHQFVLGGAVQGGAIYGTFPSMTISAPHFMDSRGVLVPSVSLAQYGATLANWFGVADAQLDAVFPALQNFGVRNLGFLA
ncbi:MAG: DUF1501 domain-containing protein [Acidobacteria bacterium]|nr:DUF1501 domain-containing protein [Acidobacteriota bacterium]